MKSKTQLMATLGLIFITFLAAIQYAFLQNVPDSVSTFSFVCITNLIGLLTLGAVRFKKLVGISKKTLFKGVVLALELTGFNFFLFLGSQHLDSVIISSVVSLYFIFITPLLLLLRKKVNFFSAIATVIAIIALLLMFGADTDALFSSVDVIYLVLADLFFAAYVVSVSIFGEDEDSTSLTLSQMIFASIFAFVGWCVENLVTHRSFDLPANADFWISALFIGICIRAIYGIVQISSQKYVSALKASLIFSAEIIITLLMNPIMSKILNISYTPINFFQVVGGVLLVIATLMVDEVIMSKLGYEDVSEQEVIGPEGEKIHRTSVAKKMVFSILTFSLVTLVVSTATFLTAIHFIRNNAVDNSRTLGEEASSISSEALRQKLEESILSQAADKTLLAEQKLEAYSDSVKFAAAYASALYRNPDGYAKREVPAPQAENGGKWTMQRTLARVGTYNGILVEQSELLGNMVDVFAPIIENNDNIATIYMGTEEGLMVSYDMDSDSAVELESYEYRDSSWYLQAKDADGYIFTDPYQDGYGRGLTITCAAPFTDAEGNFAGVIGMDILMDELNSSMVNDGIVDPGKATLIDNEGNYIAGQNVDPLSKNMGNIFDPDKDPVLRSVGAEILERKNGVVQVDTGDDAKYIAFDTIDSTDWTLCILSPVSVVIGPVIAIRDNINSKTGNVVDSVTSGVLNVIQACLMLSALILIFVTLLTGRYSKRISDPLKQLEGDVRQISGGNLELRTKVETNDEIGSLANSFNLMTDSLQKYISDLKEVTAKEERIASELSVATNIQASMLPTNFKEFLDDKKFDLFATMKPAKEVGGDFYDYFMIDSDHLALVMADVSGKGVPAALFMVIAKTLIKNRALLGGSPSEVLAYANEQLCEGNEAELFVTVWMAIIDVKTGKGIAANAGHEHPAIRRAGGQWELVVYRHSPAVATMEGLKFREHEFEIYPGDSLYVYTDGVPEATDKNDELYGTDRMLEALNRNPDAMPAELLSNVKASMDVFVGEEDQFDDITMMGVKWNV
ncbi:MAG: SpoIIE family protein phosphatase [Lachnospiraceae bacterium]|nr:SpoIIE family protein phosphatase [Lachnospiraceae bacterium]